jgi:hypothetical protein
MAGVWIGREYMERDDERTCVITNGGTYWPAEWLKPVLYPTANVRQDILAVTLLNSVKL